MKTNTLKKVAESKGYIFKPSVTTDQVGYILRNSYGNQNNAKKMVLGKDFDHAAKSIANFKNLLMTKEG